MIRLSFGLIVILSLQCLSLSNKPTEFCEPDVTEIELQILRDENFTLQTEIEMVYGEGYIPGTLCENLLYKSDEGNVVRIGECKK